MCQIQKWMMLLLFHRKFNRNFIQFHLYMVHHHIYKEWFNLDTSQYRKRGFIQTRFITYIYNDINIDKLKGKDFVFFLSSNHSCCCLISLPTFLAVVMRMKIVLMSPYNRSQNNRTYKLTAWSSDLGVVFKPCNGQTVVFLNKKLYTHCPVLVSSKSGFESLQLST